MKDYKKVKWLIVSVFLISVISLIGVYMNNYIAEAHIARALPLSIIIGLTSIAIAIFEKNK